MGVCCVSNMNLIGEQFIRELLQSESLLIRNMDYMDLLNEIVSKRVEQEIPKNHVKEYIIPDIYDPSKNISNDLYLESILLTILSKLEENNNMYIVLLYLYPFIRHDKEKTYDNFFHCFRYITQSLLLEVKKNDVYLWLKKYITFCTKDITNAVYMKLPPSDDISNSMSDLIKTVFDESNIVNFVNKLINVMTEGENDVNLITMDMFKKLFNEYDISTVENIRDYVLKDN